jgi:hypothetical protein
MSAMNNSIATNRQPTPTAARKLQRRAPQLHEAETSMTPNTRRPTFVPTTMYSPRSDASPNPSLAGYSGDKSIRSAWISVATLKGLVGKERKKTSLQCTDRRQMFS